MNMQHHTGTKAPVIARLHADCNANEAVAAMRKLIAQQAPELRATLEQAFERVVTAVEAVRDQYQSDWREAKGLAEQQQPASTAPRNDLAAMLPVQKQLVQHRVRGGAPEDESRALLDEQVRGFAAKNLATALIHHGFCRSSNADRLAAALLAERSGGKS